MALLVAVGALLLLALAVAWWRRARKTVRDRDEEILSLLASKVRRCLCVGGGGGVGGVGDGGGDWCWTALKRARDCFLDGERANRLPAWLPLLHLLPLFAKTERNDGGILDDDYHELSVLSTASLSDFEVVRSIAAGNNGQIFEVSCSIPQVCLGWGNGKGEGYGVL